MTQFATTASSPRLPDFIAVGQQRTGTTWLHKVLGGHVGLPTIKETDFFSKHYDKGLEWYGAFFGNCAADLPMGEIDPIYYPKGRRGTHCRLSHCSRCLIPDYRVKDRPCVVHQGRRGEQAS